MSIWVNECTMVLMYRNGARIGNNYRVFSHGNHVWQIDCIWRELAVVTDGTPTNPPMLGHISLSVPIHLISPIELAPDSGHAQLEPLLTLAMEPPL